jgi:hypothetical protein
MYSDNAEAQVDIAKVEDFIRQKLALAFPMFEVETLVDFDMDEDGDFTGFFTVKPNLFYQFVIQKSDKNPMIQRYLQAPDKEGNVEEPS